MLGYQGTGTPVGRIISSQGNGMQGWPGEVNQFYREGSHTNSTLILRLADRSDATNSFNISISRVGFRCVRIVD